MYALQEPPEGEKSLPDDAGPEGRMQWRNSRATDTAHITGGQLRGCVLAHRADGEGEVCTERSSVDGDSEEVRWEGRYAVDDVCAEDGEPWLSDTRGMVAEYHGTARHCGGAARVTYPEVELA